MHGIGKLTDKEFLYDGYFINNLFHGKGKIINNGYMYIGDF